MRASLASGLHGWVLRWREAAFRAWWRWRSRRRGGRPRLDPALVALIRRLSLENPLWGAPRIHGELLKLGFKCSQSTVSKYMLARRGRDTQSWMTFLRNHGRAICAIDMLTVRTLSFQRLYAIIALSHRRRRILHVAVTDRATALWLAWQMARAQISQNRLTIVVRDNDRLYGKAFRDELRALGLDDRPTQPRSPWQNGHVERVIGSIRRECLDHQIILGASHLRRVLRNYAEYYNYDRTHLALDKDAPEGRAIERQGRIGSRRVLGGLHHRYSRIGEN